MHSGGDGGAHSDALMSLVVLGPLEALKRSCCVLSLYLCATLPEQSGNLIKQQISLIWVRFATAFHGGNLTLQQINFVRNRSVQGSHNIFPSV